jgi:hypothetical protein
MMMITECWEVVVLMKEEDDIIEEDEVDVVTTTMMEETAMEKSTPWISSTLSRLVDCLRRRRRG